MCRLAAYSGPTQSLSKIVIDPGHSLVVQSQLAEEAKLAVNGDGFSLAWYGDEKAPALYKEIMPAWANPNLIHICRAIRSNNFLAHVRASTFGGATYQNCHPFTHGQWSFVHNGQIGGFEQLRRPLEATLPDPLYQMRQGITDSELLFLLIVAKGLNHDPQAAFSAAIDQIETLRRSYNIQHPLRLTFVLSDGVQIFATRHSSDGRAPTLYHSQQMIPGGTVLASEPLDGDHGNWTLLDDGSALQIKGMQVNKIPVAIGAGLAA